MGRHSRRGAAPKGDSAAIKAQGEARGAAPGAAGEGAGRELWLPGQRQAPAGAPGAQGTGPRPAPGVPGFPPGTPARGVPRFPDGTPAHGVPRLPEGTPVRVAPRLPDGTPARGVPRPADGTPARGVPRLPDGTPAHGVPRLPDGTPAQGTPRVGGGVSRARGGHPEQREAGGGWGEFKGAAGGAGTAPGGTGMPGGPATAGARQGAGGPGTALPRQRRRQGGPRQDYLDAFDEDIDVFDPRPGRRPGPDGRQGPHDPDAEPVAGVGSGPGGDGSEAAVPAQRSGGRSRAFTGIAAAAVTTALAIVVAGQVADGHDGSGLQARSATGQAGDARAPGGNAPAAAPSVAALTYDQKMARTYQLSAGLKGSGKFDAVPGLDKAPGGGQKYTYRVDVEQGLGLDGELFAEAVQKTLNDDRSWAHDGARTFERISSGKPDFVITLASPGTTATWCAKSGLDTAEDNVSCDSASTERVMINAYRWAQGSETYGDKIHAYRQMLINHEVGHRLGHGHVTCDRDGELAPVMQQQTKFLDHDGIHCRPNPWPYPRS
ncbi:DUF3152 domain-containing protein [Streptomyces sp. NPDC005706]|uniref:DUF3152 domain-containing protein n=1 Tax=Streptomyces sp. NPDC005706 TaxID=3157169 RepID=UPI0033DB6FED